MKVLDKRHLLITFLLIFINISAFSQKIKPFEGMIYYDIYLRQSIDSVPIKINYLTLHIKDSLVRVDTNSDVFGGQTTIKNIKQQKSYILLKHQDNFFAIKHLDTSKATTNYQFKKHKSKTKLNDFKIKSVYDKSTGKKKELFYYFESIDPIYLGIFNGIPGLPAEYTIPINTESTYIYQAVQIKEEIIDPKVFKIPSIFKIVSFEEFVNLENR